MKKLFSIVIGLALLISCTDKKDDEVPKDENIPLTVEFPFDDPAELDEWSLNYSDSAIAVIDLVEKKVGSGSLKIYNQCTSLNREEGISVEPDKNYEISLYAKSEEFLPGEPGCAYAYNFALVIKQGDNDQWHSIWEDSDDWYEKIIYYNPDSSGLPIQLRIVMGQKAGWIDNLIIEEI